MSRIRSILISVTVAMALTAIGIDALASSPIGPAQHFFGLVNGTHTHAVIYVVCPGPSGPGRTGPAAGDQDVAVARVAAGGGDTGAGGSEVFARITPTTIVTFKAYDQPRPIPTSARLPCQGTGTVFFSSCPLPEPCGQGAKVDAVPVRYINIAT